MHAVSRDSDSQNNHYLLLANYLFTLHYGTSNDQEIIYLLCHVYHYSLALGLHT